MSLSFVATFEYFWGYGIILKCLGCRLWPTVAPALSSPLLPWMLPTVPAPDIERSFNITWIVWWFLGGGFWHVWTLVYGYKYIKILTYSVFFSVFGGFAMVLGWTVLPCLPIASVQVEIGNCMHFELQTGIVSCGTYLSCVTEYLCWWNIRTSVVYRSNLRDNGHREKIKQPQWLNVIFHIFHFPRTYVPLSTTCGPPSPASHSAAGALLSHCPAS